ncbi:39S ribosomal protein L52, mitochondrial [Ostrinia furnacalis]|uniref:39S ribosomal protein L52, mitochondrial n=1 Tax=Ostrinia furnacalis TaxID=93504 RepID=UPI00103FC652|nr:39S ribosomal protein L52, mitochondrial [Ostrinia furnacalis]
MSMLIRKTAFMHSRILHRAFSCTFYNSTKEWRISKGLAENRTSEGILTDGPDYTFLDGRPTPLLHKQKLRLLKQREYASKIVEMCSELDFAKERYQKTLKEEAQKKQRVIDSWLKPKGKALSKK